LYFQIDLDHNDWAVDLLNILAKLAQEEGVQNDFEYDFVFTK
jgi:hypothetical protein